MGYPYLVRTGCYFDFFCFLKKTQPRTASTFQIEIWRFRTWRLGDDWVAEVMCGCGVFSFPVEGVSGSREWVLETLAGCTWLRETIKMAFFGWEIFIIAVLR